MASKIDAGQMMPVIRRQNSHRWCEFLVEQDSPFEGRGFDLTGKLATRDPGVACRRALRKETGYRREIVRITNAPQRRWSTFSAYDRRALDLTLRALAHGIARELQHPDSRTVAHALCLREGLVRLKNINELIGNLLCSRRLCRITHIVHSWDAGNGCIRVGSISFGK
jgi:hypothetical protein